MKRDNNGKLLAVPVFLKTDSGQGRIVVSFSSLEFRKRIQDIGVYIVLLITNSTFYTQELDQLYQELKKKTDPKREKYSLKN